MNIWSENPHGVSGVRAGEGGGEKKEKKKRQMEVEQRWQMTVVRHQCRLVEQETGRCDFEIWFWLMGVDWILPSLSLSLPLSLTHTDRAAVLF